MLDIVDVQGGAIISVKAQPGAKRDAILGEHAGALKITVTQKPENGKANVAIVKLLAQRLNVAKSNCSVRSGHTSRHKRVFIAELTATEVLARLGQA